MNRVSLKTAKLIPAAFNLICPDCKEPIDNPLDGSHLWGVDAGELVPGQDTTRCYTCDTDVKLPAAYLKEMGRR